MNETFQMVPLEQLRPSSTSAQMQRRKAFNKTALNDLAESVKTHGVVQAILVRPVAANGKALGHFEIVAGERRFLAAEIAGLEQIPASVRELTDEQVVELQLIENLQREDLHAMHEAESYDELVHKFGHSVDELFPRIGKSRSYVYGRMKLLALSPKARKSFYEGLLSTSVAEKLARVPSHKLQDEALPELTGTKYRDGHPMSFREAADFIEENLMLELKDAPFDVADPELNNAGPCSKCPKRTGNAPDLFNDIKNGDVCTDVVCFNAKTRAWGQRRVAEAKDQSINVISGTAAKKIAPHGLERDDPYITGGYKPLAGEAHDANYKTHKVRALLKPEAKIELLHDGKTGRVIEVVHESQLDTGKRRSSGPDPGAAARRKVAIENKFRRAVFDALRPKLGTPSDHELAHGCYNALDAELQKLVWEIRGVPIEKSTYGVFNRDKHDAMIDQLKGDDVVSFMNDCLFAPLLRTTAWAGEKRAARLLDAAKKHRVDVAKIRRELAPPKKKAKPAAKKKAKR